MTRASPSKIRISITIFPFVNTLLEKMSKRSGKSKSNIVETALKDFLSKQLEKDAHALSELKFHDVPCENDWLSIQSSL